MLAAERDRRGRARLRRILLVRETLTVLPREHLGLQLGVTAVLHTWTRELLFHPHVHCVVSV